MKKRLRQKRLLSLLLLLILSILSILTLNQEILAFEAYIESEEELLSTLSKALEEKRRDILIHYSLDDLIRGHEVREYLQRAINEKNPYIKNTIDSWDLTVSSQNNQVEVYIQFQYLSSREEDLFVYQETERIIQSITSTEMNPHQVVKALYDYIVQHVEYDQSMTRYSAYEALEGHAVCQGYALLFYQLLEEAGIESTIIRGELLNKPHGWNMVNLEGEWYHFDATQDSTHYHTHGENPYNHYALTDSQIARSHLWIRGEYPLASWDYTERLLSLLEKDPQEDYKQLLRELNLHYLLDEYTAYTQEELKDLIKEAVLFKEPSVSMRSFDPFYRSDLFNAIFQEIIAEDQSISQYLKSYRIAMRRYSRDNYSNSIILTLFFVYE